MEWNHLSIPKLQRWNRWRLEMDKWFHPTNYDGCNYLFMLGPRYFVFWSTSIFVWRRNAFLIPRDFFVAPEYTVNSPFLEICARFALCNICYSEIPVRLISMAPGLSCGLPQCQWKNPKESSSEPTMVKCSYISSNVIIFRETQLHMQNYDPLCLNGGKCNYMEM